MEVEWFPTACLVIIMLKLRFLVDSVEGHNLGTEAWGSSDDHDVAEHVAEAFATCIQCMTGTSWLPRLTIYAK